MLVLECNPPLLFSRNLQNYSQLLSGYQLIEKSTILKYCSMLCNTSELLFEVPLKSDLLTKNHLIVNLFTIRHLLGTIS